MNDKQSSPWQSSRRTFLGILAAAGVVGAQSKDEVAAFRKSVTGFADDNNPVDLLPRLSPPPAVVPGVAKPRLDLNGTWRFNPAPPPDFWKGGSDSGWSDISVPGQWILQGFNVKPRQAGGYRLRFQAPADWAGRRVKLRFDAVYSKAGVWMNGKPVGSHLGAFTPFELDVSSAILPGEENVLALAVTSDTLADALTVGLEMVGHAMGGIIRKVSIFVVPTVNVSSMHVETRFDREYRNATLRVLIDVANETAGWKPIPGAELTFSLREHGSIGAPMKLTSVKLPDLTRTEVLSQEIEIPISAPKKWDAEHPNLYVLNCELQLAGSVYSTERRFGFRQVEIKDGRFLLNGQPIRLRGMSRQDTHPLTGRTVAPEIYKQDIDWMLWANCNNTYTCAFLPDEESIDLCDEKGLYVMDEPGTCWVSGRSGLSYDDPKLFPYYLQPVLEMIERDRSHPSVITWMIADESPFGRNFREVLKMTRAVDPSRPVHMAWDPEGGSTLSRPVDPRVRSPFDLGSWHYPSVNQLAKAAESRRPVIFDQSVSAYFVNVPELMTDPGMRDDWGRQYEVFWEKCWATPSILGGQAFNLNDDQYLTTPVSGNGDWGFVDPWRRAKPEMWHIRKIHSPVKVKDAAIPLPVEGQPIEIPIENRYDFANLSEVRIEWSIGDESGVAEVQVPPHGEGTIAIRPKRADLKGRTLDLKFVRNGVTVDTYKLPIGPPTELAVAASSKPKRHVQLVQAKETITARGEGFEWVISRETGQVIKAVRNGQTVLVGGPVLMVLTTKEYEMPQGVLRPRPATFSLLNETCTDWKADSVAAARSEGAVEITVTGHYKDAAGSYSLRIGPEGEAVVAYRFVYAGGEKVPPVPRQIGMVFYTPRSIDTLAWKRKAQWSVYPEDHIGRAEGVAKALPDPSLPAKEGAWMEVSYREKPSWPWFADANALGTRDFRATRRNILRASLTDPAGHGITLLSDGTHHTRAFLDGSRVGLLVAYLSGPGGVGKWLHGINEVAGADPAPLEKGTEFKDSLRLALGTV